MNRTHGQRQRGTSVGSAARTGATSSRAEEGDAWIASRAARSGVVRREFIGPLQRSVGNQQVQRLISVQRQANLLQESDIDPALLEDMGDKFQLIDQGGGTLEKSDFSEELENDIGGKLHLMDEGDGRTQIDDRDFSDELKNDIDGKFQLTGDAILGDTPSRPRGTSQVEGQSDFAQRRAESERLRREMRDEKRRARNPLTKLRKAARKVGGFFRGQTVGAYGKWGAHAGVTNANKLLKTASGHLKAGNAQEARGFIPKKTLLEDAPMGQLLKIAVTSPILFGRMAATNAKAKKLKAKLKEMEAEG